jgi:copper oxidase (laccase) domain-containing protein
MPRGEGKYSLNLHKAILLELLKAGIPRGNIEVTSLRTDLDNDLFPSFRLEGGKADRFMFAMGLK